MTGQLVQGERLAITQSQAGLLVVDRMVANRQLYNAVAELELDPARTADQLRAALTGVVAAQPSLRLVFADLPQPHAVLTPPPERVPLPSGPLRCDADVDAAVRDLAGCLLDPQAGPLYRFRHLAGAGRSVLVLVVHHLVWDGFSLGPFVADLAAFLTGAAPGAELVRDREAALARELAVQDGIATAAETGRRAADWAQRLGDLPGVTLYPRPHRPVRTAFTGRRVEWLVDGPAATAVGQACARLDVSPFVFFTAVYAAVLARHAAVSPVVVGSPFLARRTAGSYRLCGFFVNTLPVVVDVDWAATFDGLVAEVVRPAVDHARSRVDVAFNQVVANLRVDRSSDRNPLFSCMIAMQERTVTGAGVVLRATERHNGTAKFDCWLGVTPADGGWLLTVEHDDELLPPAVADGLVASLRTAVARAAAGSGVALSELFGDDSYARSWESDGVPAVPPRDSLDDWVRATAAGDPASIAIEEPGGVVTYAALFDAVARVAGGLDAAGVVAGDTVGVRLDGLRDTVVTILAALRCGAAYLPLDAALPRNRLAAMARRADCRLIVGESGVGESGTDVSGCRTVTLAGLERGSPRLTGGDGPAVYVMFSSGSTGQPKGIRMHSGPLLNLTGWQVAALDMGPRTRFMQYAPLGFDVSFQEIIPTLCAGGTVVSRGPVDRRDFPALVRRVAATAVTHLYLPVSALRPLVQAAAADGADLPALRYLCVSGEQLIVDEEVRRFCLAHPHTVLVNLYGPTETHAVTTHRLRGTDPAWPTHVPIGRPMSGVAAYVVDVTGHLAPAGVVGDLHLGGRCPALGYVDDPEETAARFPPDRFHGAGRMYRTGDQVLRADNGDLVFLGRRDDQVKIRGNRVELGELESVTDAVTGVRRSVAAVRHTPAGPELVLFVLGEPADGAVAERLRAELPDYLLPAWTFPVTQVPVTVNGKVDRSALLAVAEELIAAGTATTGATAPVYRDELQRELAGLWSALLRVPDLDPDRSLLECGAHSLTVFAALAQVRADYGVAVPILGFFQRPTIAALADAIRAGRSGEAS